MRVVKFHEVISRDRGIDAVAVRIGGDTEPLPSRRVLMMASDGRL